MENSKNYFNVNYSWIKSNVKENKKNRLINRSHCNKLKKKMNESLSVLPPFTYNVVTCHIIDGQHRVTAFLEAVEKGIIPPTSTIDAKFVEIPEDKEMEAIMEANINSKNWKLDDFVNKYSKEVDNDSFKKLVSFADENELCKENGKPKYRITSAILTGRSCQKDLKNGTLEITDEQIELGKAVHNELLTMLNIMEKPKKGSWIESMAIAWNATREHVDFKNLKKKLKTKTIKAMPYNNQDHWLNIFGAASRNF